MQDPKNLAPITKEEIAYTSQIKQNLRSIEQLKEELKTKKDSFKDGYEMDAEYSKIAEEAKSIKKALKARKDKIISESDSMQVLQEDIKNLSYNIKETQLTLSDYLFNYTVATGMQTVENHNEEVKYINKLLTVNK